MLRWVRLDVFNCTCNNKNTVMTTLKYSLVIILHIVSILKCTSQQTCLLGTFKYDSNSALCIPCFLGTFANQTNLTSTNLITQCSGKTKCDVWSSSYVHTNFSASAAIDYDTTNFFVSGVGDFQYWAVDLGASKYVGSIILWDRTSCCQYREDGFKVYIGNYKDTYYTYTYNTTNNLCYTDQNQYTNRFPLVATCNMTGRYLYLVSGYINEYINFAEIAVLSSIPCTSCSTGSFANETGLSICYSCGAGKYTHNFSTVQCSDCLPGTFSESMAATKCFGCPVSTYNNLYGQTSCTNCSACNTTEFMYSLCPTGSTYDTHICRYPKVCPDGYTLYTNHSPGLFNQIGQDITCRPCDRCPDGYYLTPHTCECEMCTLCPNGYHSLCTQNQDSTCIYINQCKEAKNIRPYKWLAETPTIRCDKGYQMVNISHQIPECIKCPDYLISTNGLWCEPCIGFKIPYFDNSICICPFPTILASNGDCICPKGYSFGVYGCEQCAMNQYNNVDFVIPDEWWLSSNVCQTCPIGEYSLIGETSCTVCPMYQYRINDNETCQSCTPGYYAMSSSSSICTECSLNCSTGQYSLTCPTDPTQYICYDCTNIPLHAYYIPNTNVIGNYQCFWQCESSYFMNINQCDLCTDVTCTPGKVLTPCTSIQDANCDWDCVNETKPTFNSIWAQGCEWGCADGYYIQGITYDTWIQYECIEIGSLAFWKF